MSSTKPNFNDWRRLNSIEVWEVAALIHGFDPRAASEVAGRDPHNPTCPSGVPPDTSWEERMLITAVETGVIQSASPNTTAADRHTKVTTASLLPWLTAQGYGNLSAELASSTITNRATGTTQPVPAVSIMSEPDRRLIALRALGGDAKWKRFNGSQQWTFTKIKALTAQEKRTNKPRNDEKTIRRDLTHAAEAESAAKKSGAAR